MKSDNTSAEPYPEPEVQECSGGFTVKYRNRYLYSTINPKAGAERRASKLPVSSGFIYLAASPLLFYGIDTLFSRLGKDNLLILLELDSRLAELTRKYIEKRKITLPDGSSPILFTDQKDLLEYLDSADLDRFRHVDLISLSGGLSLSSDIYSKCRTSAENFLKTYWNNRATLIQMGRLWIDNIFANIPLIPDSVPLSGLFTDKPVVVTGAGESLEGSLEEISFQRDDIFLLAADTSLPVLLEAGIYPDAVMALEGQHANIYDFFGNLELPLICDLTASPALLHKYRGPVSFVLSRFSRINIFDRLKASGILVPEIPPLGSVGVVALYTGLKLTEKPVFFTGLDFAFRPGKTHSRSTPSLKNRLTGTCRTESVICFSHGFEPPVRSVSGKNGLKILTTPNLSGYAGLIGELNGSGRLIDLGRTGLPLPVEQLDLNILKTPSSGELIKSADNTETNFSERTCSVASKEICLDFLRNEQKVLEELVEIGYLWLAGNRNDRMEKKIRNFMNSIDYLSLSFPDRGGKEIFSESYLKRFLTHGARLAERIGNLLSPES